MISYNDVLDIKPNGFDMTRDGTYNDNLGNSSRKYLPLYILLLLGNRKTNSVQYQRFKEGITKNILYLITEKLYCK